MTQSTDEMIAVLADRIREAGCVLSEREMRDKEIRRAVEHVEQAAAILRRMAGMAIEADDPPPLNGVPALGTPGEAPEIESKPVWTLVRGIRCTSPEERDLVHAMHPNASVRKSHTDPALLERIEHLRSSIGSARAMQGRLADCAKPFLRVMLIKYRELMRLSSPASRRALRMERAIRTAYPFLTGGDRDAWEKSFRDLEKIWTRGHGHAES